VSHAEAVDRITTLVAHAEAIGFVEWLEFTKDWPGHAALVHRMATSTEPETMLDHLAVLRFALIFRAIECQIHFEPLGGVGPDLGVTHRGTGLRVEVTRFRPVNPGPQPWDGHGGLLPYGNPERDVLKSIGKIRRKLPQASGARAAIAIWNDDQALDHVEMKCAAKDLCSQVPPSVQFVLYASEWFQTITHRQLHCFPLQDPLDDSAREMTTQLEAISLRRAVAIVDRTW